MRVLTRDINKIVSLRHLFIFSYCTLIIKIQDINKRFQCHKFKNSLTAITIESTSKGLITYNNTKTKNMYQKKPHFCMRLFLVVPQ